MLSSDELLKIYAKTVNPVELPCGSVFVGQVWTAYGDWNYYSCNGQYFKVYYSIGD